MILAIQVAGYQVRLRVVTPPNVKCTMHSET